ncbi:acyl-CoA carboxylase epsilon subunit [Streptomyces sp. NPDC050738]|uniref:acyl-CoA carboxylase epsilon subunit n=1 Tax=Streptomyces sp. NPDC050738 TaxID=3154744 RepID=UPI00341F4599
MDGETLFTIIRGRPDASEIAALTAVLLLLLRADEGMDEGADGEAGEPGSAPWGRDRLRRRPRVSWARS